MRYLVAAKGPDLNAEIHSRFGHADYFLIVDPDTLQFETVQIEAEHTSDHGMSFFQPYQITHILAGNFGNHAFDDIQKAGYKAFVCRQMSVRQAVESVREGQITEITEPTVKHKHDHHH